MNATVISVEVTGLGHPEGPALMPDGSLVFVETFRERVSRWRPSQPVELYSETGGRPNACAVGVDGVYITQMGAAAAQTRRHTPPSIQRLDGCGKVTTVLTEVDGHKLRAPNDLCFGPRGNLLFTDPGAFSLARPEDGYIFSLKRDGTCDFAVNTGTSFPNGLIALPDDSVVWVESYTRRVRRRYADGVTREIVTLPRGHMPDGLKASTDGRLFIATIASGGVDVVSLSGASAEFIDTGGEPLNCVFAGEDLYVADGGLIRYTDPSVVTANSGRLLRVRVGVTGLALFTGRIAEGE